MLLEISALALALVSMVIIGPDVAHERTPSMNNAILASTLFCGSFLCIKGALKL